MQICGYVNSLHNTYCTISDTVTVLARLPAWAASVMGYVPEGVELLVVTVNVTLPEPVTDAADQLAFAPGTKPTPYEEKVVLALKPPIGINNIVYTAGVPADAVRAPLFGLTNHKSGPSGETWQAAVGFPDGAAKVECLSWPVVDSHFAQLIVVKYDGSGTVKGFATVPFHQSLSSESNVLKNSVQALPA